MALSETQFLNHVDRNLPLVVLSGVFGGWVSDVRRIAARPKHPYFDWLLGDARKHLAGASMPKLAVGHSGRRCTCPCRAEFDVHVRYAIGSVQAVSEERRGLPLELPGTLTRCRRAIKQHMGDFKRIWFEDCSVGQQNPPDPFGSFRVTPILARDTKLEFIGGPYARPHYRTQSTQFVDGSLHGHDAVTPDLVRTLANGYGVDAIVCWSPGWKQYCAANPSIFEPLFGYVGDPNYDDRFVGYRIKRAQLPHEKLGVKLAAKVNRISLEVPSNAIGKTILIPYHWVPAYAHREQNSVRKRCRLTPFRSSRSSSLMLMLQ